MLFKLEANKAVFDLNPELKAIEEFARLTDRQMQYVVLSCDYKSPFRKLAPEDRKFQAAVTAGYKLEKEGKRLDMNGRNLVAGKVGNVEAAVKKYKELQRDEDYETLVSISTLISQIRELNLKENKTTAELDKAINMTMKVDKLVETKKRLEEILDMREEAPSTIAGEEEDDELADNPDNLSVLARLNEGLI